MHVFTVFEITRWHYTHSTMVNIMVCQMVCKMACRVAKYMRCRIDRFLIEGWSWSVVLSTGWNFGERDLWVLWLWILVWICRDLMIYDGWRSFRFRLDDTGQWNARNIWTWDQWLKRKYVAASLIAAPVLVYMYFFFRSEHVFSMNTVLFYQISLYAPDILIFAAILFLKNHFYAQCSAAALVSLISSEWKTAPL